MPKEEHPSTDGATPAEAEWARYAGPARTLVLLNALLALTLELAMFAFVVWWFLALDLALWARVPLAVAAFAAFATLWGLLVSPKARYPLPTLWTVVFKLAAYGCSTLALWGLGYPVAAIVFAVLAAANTAAVTYVRTRPAV